MRKLDRPRDIIDRRRIAAALAEATVDASSQSDVRKTVLEHLRQALERGEATIQKRFETREDWGLNTVAERSYLMDQILRILFDHGSEQVFKGATQTTAEPVSLVAMGGYGREELSPESDIDLLFLLPYKLPPSTEQLVEFMLYTLWDLNLKVGHATRSLDDNIRQAQADMVIRTAMLDSRWIWGDQDLFQNFWHRFQAEVVADSAMSFVEAKLAERDARHERTGDSRYVLEPNIKEDKGGLRDLHSLQWIAKYLYGTDDFGELAERDIITDEEARSFERAHSFLTTVRCHIQYITHRPDNRLTFDLQKKIASAMGYADNRAGTSHIERFMKHYYLTAKDVGDLTRIVLASMEEEHKRTPFFQLPKGMRQRKLEGFVVEGRRISAVGVNVFERTPLRILEIFALAQEHGLSIHPATLKIISERSRDVVGLRDHEEANQIFLDILTSPKGPEATLRRMSEAGVFGRFIPDFGRVVAQMQYDMYHVYTTDEHTIRAIGILHKIEQGGLEEDLPIATEVVKKVQSRRALYVATLLHDIAKGRGGDHSILGAEVAQELCPRLGLTDEETETVSWLVLQHLLMSHTAFKRDLDDPKTIQDFVAEVQSPERLKLLLVLTCADIRAVGPKVWNGWKATLLRDLYLRADEVMSGAKSGLSVAARVDRAKQTVLDRLSDLPDAESDVAVHVALDSNSPSYWLGYNTDAHERHIRLIQRAAEEQNPLAIDVNVDPDRSVTEFIVYTQDHPGLFVSICGALALSEASIVDAKIETFSNGMALDTFTVQGVMNEEIQSSRKLKRIGSRIDAAVRGELRLKEEVRARSEKDDRHLNTFQVPSRVIIDNTASHVHTVIEVNGQDRTGFLYDVARALKDTGLQLSSAHISTFGERIVDVFYVKDIFGMKVTHDAKIKQVRHALEAAVSGRPAPKTEAGVQSVAAE